MEIPSQQAKTTQEVTIKKGGFRTMPFIIANETFEKIASFGLSMNMIFYLVGYYHLDATTGATVLFVWSAISYFTPVIGAFLSDSFLGRFRTIAYGTLFSLLGLFLLWLTAVISKLRPPSCNLREGNCEPATAKQLALLFLSFAIMSIGAGGIRPCSIAFGADQITEKDDLKREKILRHFFHWYYLSIGVSLLLASTVLVYIQDKKGWVVGFGVPLGFMFFSTVTFYLGECLYMKVKPNKSLFNGFAKVIAAAWKNRHLDLPVKISDGRYYHHGSNLVAPTQKLRFLNKACILENPGKDLDSDGMALDQWSLCTTTQVENLKAIIKVLPIWSTGIMLAITISQYAISALQANSMNRHLTKNFSIPPASFGVFSILSMGAAVIIYNLVVVPFLSKYTKLRHGLCPKVRMGLGVIITCLATAISALVETKRRETVIREGVYGVDLAVVNMSAMWLLPQHCLHGMAEAFNIIGQIEFYYSQFPESMSSIAMALVSLGFGVGSLLAALIIVIVKDVTTRGGKESWVSKNINKGHYDYYYWLLTALSMCNICYYILCSWAYDRQDKEDEDAKEEDMPKS